MDEPQKICSKCGKNPAIGRFKQCESCRKKQAEAMMKWKKKNPSYNSIYLKDWNRERRETVLAHYGDHCSCCGEHHFEFLAIDHKDGGGEKHRGEVGQGSNMINWIINNNFPDEFQILCHNCNQAIGYYGFCPHEREVKLHMIPVVDVGDE